MRYWISVIVLLGMVATVTAERNPKYENWLTSERLTRWQNLSQNMTYVDLYTLMGEMYYLDRKPWGELEKQILLKMTETMTQLQQDRLANKPVIVPDYVTKGEGCQEYDITLDEMVSWQDDPRFIKFQSTFYESALAARGLARIGEPAFDAVIKAFDKKPIRDGAPWAIRLMMAKEDGFLRNDPAKYVLAKRALMKATRSEDQITQLFSIDALRYFPDQEIFDLLENISLNDTWREGNGSFPLRSRAQEALKFMRANGGGF